MLGFPENSIDKFKGVGIGGTKGLDTSKLKLFVGNLPPSCGSSELFAFFRPYGDIREAVVIPDRFRIRSRCYGFVTFANRKNVEKVLALRNCRLDGYLLNIVLAVNGPKNRRSTFQVAHGCNGHKPLPHCSAVLKNKYSFETNSVENSPRTDNGVSSIAISYDDPSLFRTANIQTILPARFTPPKKTTISKIAGIKKDSNSDIDLTLTDGFPNRDISKDFGLLLKHNAEVMNKMSTVITIYAGSDCDEEFEQEQTQNKENLHSNINKNNQKLYRDQPLKKKLSNCEKSNEMLSIAKRSRKQYDPHGNMEFQSSPSKKRHLGIEPKINLKNSFNFTNNYTNKYNGKNCIREQTQGTIDMNCANFENINIFSEISYDRSEISKLEDGYNFLLEPISPMEVLLPFENESSNTDNLNKDIFDRYEYFFE